MADIMSENGLQLVLTTPEGCTLCEPGSLPWPTQQGYKAATRDALWLQSPMLRQASAKRPHKCPKPSAGPSAPGSPSHVLQGGPKRQGEPPNSTAPVNLEQVPYPPPVAGSTCPPPGHHSKRPAGSMRCTPAGPVSSPMTRAEALQILALEESVYQHVGDVTELTPWFVTQRTGGMFPLPSIPKLEKKEYFSTLLVSQMQAPVAVPDRFGGPAVLSDSNADGSTALLCFARTLQFLGTRGVCPAPSAGVAASTPGASSGMDSTQAMAKSNRVAKKAKGEGWALVVGCSVIWCSALIEPSYSSLLYGPVADLAFAD